MLRDLIILVVGWLLGLLAPAIVDGIRRRRESNRVKAALKVELLQVALRIATACHLVQMRFGDVDRPYLIWLAGVLRRLPGANTMQSVVSSVEMQLALSEEQLAAFSVTQRAKEGGVLTLRKYAVPLLDARVSALWELAPRLQDDLLEVRAYLELFNDDVEQTRFYFQLSFQDLTEQNREILKQNLAGSYKAVASRGRVIVDKILAAPL